MPMENIIFHGLMTSHTSINNMYIPGRYAHNILVATIITLIIIMLSKGIYS